MPHTTKKNLRKPPTANIHFDGANQNDDGAIAITVWTFAAQ